MSKYFKLKVTAIVIASLFCTFGLTPARENIFTTMKPAELANLWLMNDCGTDDGPAFEVAITALGAELEPLFLRGLREGPPSERLAEIERAAGERFQKRRDAFDKGETFGLDPENVELARSRTREDYLKRVTTDFAAGYRGQALRGLVLIRSAEAPALLKDLADDPDSPLGSMARELLSRSAQRGQ